MDAPPARRPRPRRAALTLLAVTALPVLLGREMWLELWRGGAPQAWDGSGHYALTRIYTETIFPATFGWTDAYFAGMASPNYYPPFFYWLVALLSRSHLLSFPAAFKAVLLLPTLLLPAAVWMLTRRLSARDRLASGCAAFALLPLLLDVRLTNSAGVMGLSYASTFLLGLYTQPLGFVLLLAWYTAYNSPAADSRLSRTTLTSLLLALTLLTSFFAATVAALLVLTTLLYDVLRLARAADPAGRRPALHALAAHALSPLAALCLTLFWLAPLVATYDYVVTRPQRATLDQLVPAGMWVWYAFAALGSIVWLRRPAAPRVFYPYLAGCVALAAPVFIAGAPGWFPSHPPRLASTLNFMLAPFVGRAVAAVLRALAALVGRVGLQPVSGRPCPRSVGAALLPVGAAILLFVFVTPAPARWAFYDEEEWERIAPVLGFARGHKDGRYLVEVQPRDDIDAAHDGRAISAYLGAQGNSSLGLFFREAAPNVLFLNPLAGALSAVVDAYGISSVLTDDTDFIRQPLSQHLDQARLYGTRYLVVRSPANKERLKREGSVGASYDLGEWSVFDIGGEAQSAVRPLAYKPALVAGGLNLKLRRRDDYGFVRLAEEQFASGWYNVLLARAPEAKLDRLDVPDGFGALVVEGYDYEDEGRAYERLKEFSQRRPLVLMSAASPLFTRIRSAASEFPRLRIIERPQEPLGAWLESDHPTSSYAGSGARRAWGELRRALDEDKTRVAPASGPQGYHFGEGRIDITYGVQTGEAPVLLATTFHPNWRRTDGGALYATTPMLTLTFVRGHTGLTFSRSWLDLLALCASAGTLLLLILGPASHSLGRCYSHIRSRR